MGKGAIYACIGVPCYRQVKHMFLPEFDLQKTHRRSSPGVGFSIYFLCFTSIIINIMQ